MLSFIVIFTLITASALEQPPSYECGGNQPVVAPFPQTLMPSNYTALVRFRDENTAFVKERKSGEQLWLKRITSDNTRKVGIGQFNVTYNDTACSSFSNISKVELIYPTHKLIREVLEFNGMSISQLIQEIEKKFKNGNSSTINFGGIDAVKWIGCKNITETNITLQIKVIYASENSVQPYSPFIKNPLILSIHLLLFNVTNNVMLINSSVFDIVDLGIPEKFENEMPVGVFCFGMPKSSISAVFPSKFEASFTYRRNDEVFPHRLDVHYDAEERVVAFQTDVEKDGVIPFLGHLPDVFKERSHLFVLHDFSYDLQFILDKVTDVCIKTSRIETNFGDVRLINDSMGKIAMKSGDELFLNLTQSSFYYAGQRNFEDGHLNVYVSASKLSAYQNVVELLFPCKLDYPQKTCLPRLIILYDKDSTGKRFSTTAIELIAFHDLKVPKTHDVPVSVQSCRLPDGSVSLYVAIKDVSISDLAKVGMSRVRAALRATLAKFAGISTFRIGEIFFKGSNKSVLALFTVNNATETGTPGRTVDLKVTISKNETSVEQAVAILNNTLSKQDILVSIEEAKFSLTISRSTLEVISEIVGPLPSPAQSYTGYSGGSMFVLAAFMLLLGSAIGSGIVLFLWKRQRIGSLAYQVFE